MKVALITGSYPPEVCGVGDYTFTLASSLRSAGVSVEAIHEKDWSPLSMHSLRRRLLAVGADVLHMQYPTKGYGWQLGPHALALSMPLVVTMHEASQVHLLRKMSLLPLMLRSPLVIATNEYERRYLTRLAPWIRRNAVVIPIGSNIQVRSGVEKMSSKIVTHFGLIRPDKGLEEVLRLASKFGQHGQGFSVRIVGVPFPGDEAYYSQLRSASAGLPVQWLIDLPREQLEVELARTSIAYLPFPDGASERRGSLIALLMNSAAVITTRGGQTPPAMTDALVLAQDAEKAAEAIMGLAQRPGELRDLQYRARTYSERFAWQRIASQHISAYTQLIESRGTQRG